MEPSSRLLVKVGVKRYHEELGVSYHAARDDQRKEMSVQIVGREPGIGDPHPIVPVGSATDMGTLRPALKKDPASLHK